MSFWDSSKVANQVRMKAGRGMDPGGWAVVAEVAKGWPCSFATHQSRRVRVRPADRRPGHG
jgi:hypothetical protein